MDSHLPQIPREAAQTWLGADGEKQMDAFILKAPGATLGRINQKWVHSQQVLEWTGIRRARWGWPFALGTLPRPVTQHVGRSQGAGGGIVFLSQTDYLILLGPTLPEHRAVYGPCAQSITYSYSLKIIAAHLLLPVQLVTARLGGDICTAVLKPSNSFSMATKWADRGPH